MTQVFAVCMDDDKGPLCKQFFDDLDEAKFYCRELAQSTGVECFVYSFDTSTEIARYHKNFTREQLSRGRPLTSMLKQL